MPCMSLFTCHETLKYCVVVELLDITSSSNLKKKKGDHINKYFNLVRNVFQPQSEEHFGTNLYPRLH